MPNHRLLPATLLSLLAPAPAWSEPSTASTPIYDCRPSGDNWSCNPLEASAFSRPTRAAPTIPDAVPVPTVKATSVGQATVAPKPPVEVWDPTTHPDPQWRRCGPLPVRYQILRPAAKTAADDKPAVEVTSDVAEGVPDGKGDASFLGDVSLQRGDQLLRADTVSYNQEKGKVRATGDVYYQDPGVNFTAASADIDLENNSGVLRDVDYRLPQRHARGLARKVEFQGTQLSRYRDVSYTTCLPQSNAWQIQTDRLDLDRDSGEGRARGATLRVKDVPVFYTPYLSFPIDDRRKSGILAPSIGSSDQTGLDISVPYYWNIAPNYDATLTPRLMAKRGVMLGTEFRFLQPSYSGEAYLDLIPDDRLANDGEGHTRGQARLNYRQTLGPRLLADVDAGYVSDKGYLDDFGNTLSVANTLQVERRADLTYFGDFYQVTGRAQYFQVANRNLANNARSYSRLPQVLFTGRLPDQALGLEYDWRGEYVYFDRPDSVTGHRVDLYPSISRPITTAASFVTPKAGVRYTRYELNNQTAGLDSSPDRTTPVFSLDSGLIFERPASWAGLRATNTLEPRLYYLYVAREKQDDLPVFDSTDLDFSFAQLFRDNRFAGADRMGDANQLTAALSTRYIHTDTGTELAHASIGEILYFRNREVTLPGGPVEETSSSEFVAELAARLSTRINTRATYQWDPDRGRTQRSALRLQYKQDRDHLFNAAYRFRRDAFEQVDLSARWSIDTAWTTIGRWDYSIKEDTSVDVFAGLEYENCCYIVRGVYHRFVRDEFNFADKRNEFLLQFVLKGLTGIGDDIEKLMENNILGYRSDDENS